MAFHRNKQSQAAGVDIGTRFHRRREIDVDPCGPRNVKKKDGDRKKESRKAPENHLMNGDFMGFLWWFYGDLMGSNGDLMMILWDLMGFYGDLMGLNGI